MMCVLDRLSGLHGIGVLRLPACLSFFLLLTASALAGESQSVSQLRGDCMLATTTTTTTTSHLIVGEEGRLQYMNDDDDDDDNHDNLYL